jgi:bile acid:Na+ symporter, BASS family
MIAVTSTAITAYQLLNSLLNGGLVIMIITLVLSLGLSFTVAQVIAPMHRWVVLVGMVVVNVALMPAIAWGVCDLLPLSTPHRVALVLVTIAAAGPAGLKACELAKRADMAMAVSFVIVLQLVNIVAAPLWARAVVTGASVSGWTIIKDLLILVLVPLVLGLWGRARYGEHAGSWKEGLEKVSNIALYIAIGAGIAANWKVLVSIIGSWVIVASVVIIVISVVLGGAVGFKDPHTRTTTAMISSMRFTPIGLIVITTQLHGQAQYLVPGLVFALIDTIIPFLIGAEIGRHASPAQKAERKGAPVRPAVPAASA